MKQKQFFLELFLISTINCFAAQKPAEKPVLVSCQNQTFSVSLKTLNSFKVFKNIHDIDLHIKKRKKEKLIEDKLIRHSGKYKQNSTLGKIYVEKLHEFEDIQKEYNVQKKLPPDAPIHIDDFLNCCGATADDFKTFLKIAAGTSTPSNLKKRDDLLLQINLSDVFDCPSAMQLCIEKLAYEIEMQSALNDDNELLARTMNDLPDTVLNYELQPALVDIFKKNLNQITKNCCSTIEPKKVRQIAFDDKKKFLLLYLQNGKVKQVDLKNNGKRKTFSTRPPKPFDTLLGQTCSDRGGMKPLPRGKICVWSKYKPLIPFIKNKKTITRISIWDSTKGICEKSYDVLVNEETKVKNNIYKNKDNLVKILCSFSRKKPEKKVFVFDTNTVIVLSGSGRPQAKAFDASSDVPINQFQFDSDSIIVNGKNCITLTQKNNTTIKMVHWNPLTGSIAKTIEAPGKLPQKIHYTNHNNDVLLNIKDADGVERFVNCSSGTIVRDIPTPFAKYNERTKTIEILEVKNQHLQQRGAFNAQEKIKDLIILPDEKALISLSEKGTVEKHLITPFEGLSAMQTVVCALVAQRPKVTRSHFCKQILANLSKEIQNGIKKVISPL